MEIIIDEGIVLRKKDYGDSDRLITIFSKNNGKISFYLKGIRKSKKRDKEAVELFSLSTFYFSKKQEKYILNDFEILDYNLNLKLNMESLEIGYYLLSLIDKILLENQKQEKLYILLKESLNFLDKKFSLKESYLLILYFLYRIIVNEGIKFSIYGEKYFNIKDSVICNDKNNGVEITEKEYFLIKESIENIRELKNKNMELKDILGVIRLYENYISYHLEVNLNFKNYFLEAHKWLT